MQKCTTNWRWCHRFPLTLIWNTCLDSLIGNVSVNYALQFARPVPSWSSNQSTATGCVSKRESSTNSVLVFKCKHSLAVTTGRAVGVTTAPQIFQLVSVRRASDPKVDTWWPIFLCRWHQGLEQSAAHCHRSVYSVIIPSTPEIPSVHKVVSIMTMTFC